MLSRAFSFFTDRHNQTYLFQNEVVDQSNLIQKINDTCELYLQPTYSSSVCVRDNTWSFFANCTDKIWHSFQVTACDQNVSKTILACISEQFQKAIDDFKIYECEVAAEKFQPLPIFLTVLGIGIGMSLCIISMYKLSTRSKRVASKEQEESKENQENIELSRVRISYS